MLLRVLGVTSSTFIELKLSRVNSVVTIYGNQHEPVGEEPTLSLKCTVLMSIPFRSRHHLAEKPKNTGILSVLWIISLVYYNKIVKLFLFLVLLVQ